MGKYSKWPFYNKWKYRKYMIYWGPAEELEDEEIRWSHSSNTIKLIRIILFQNRKQWVTQ